VKAKQLRKGENLKRQNDHDGTAYFLNDLTIVLCAAPAADKIPEISGFTRISPVSGETTV